MLHDRGQSSVRHKHLQSHLSPRRGCVHDSTGVHRRSDCPPHDLSTTRPTHTLDRPAAKPSPLSSVGWVTARASPSSSSAYVLVQHGYRAWIATLALDGRDAGERPPGRIELILVATGNDHRVT